MDNNFSLEQNVGVSASEAPASTSPTKPHKNTKLISLVAGIAGLVVGAAGAFGIFKLVTKQPEKCPECRCPNQNAQITPNDLDYSFLKMEADSNNIIYSPLSIKNGLSLLRAGADGDTKTELDKALGDDNVPIYDDIPDTLSLANAVFIRDDYREYVLPSYITTVQDTLNSEVIYDSFSNTAKMDEWVKQKTFSLIDNIGIDVTEATEMVLSNALAIQMDWKYQFDDNDTTGRSFYKKDGTEMIATTMERTILKEEAKYFIDDSVKAISLPLDSTSDDVELDFIAIMPENGFSEYIDNFTQSDIDDIINKLIPTNQPRDGVSIYIPKFKFDYQLDFSNDLKTLGIKLAFDRSRADFSNMTSNPLGLFVSDAIHKATIDFSEEGVKAAAVTAFAMSDITAIGDEPQPVIIKIDHPFLFLIRDAKNGAIWFTGAVYEPNLWEDDADSYRPRL